MTKASAFLEHSIRVLRMMESIVKIFLSGLDFTKLNSIWKRMTIRTMLTRMANRANLIQKEPEARYRPDAILSVENVRSVLDLAEDLMNQANLSREKARAEKP